MSKQFANLETTAIKKAADDIAIKLGNMGSQPLALISAKRVKDAPDGSKQFQLEFLQRRELSGNGSARINVTAALNAGDDRFNSGTTLRVWQKVTEKGLMETFKTVFTKENMPEFISTAGSLDINSQTHATAIFKEVNSITVKGVDYLPRIVVRETCNIEELPKNIREEVQGNTEYADRYILQTGGDDSERIVCGETGRTVYRWQELAAGTNHNDMPDQIVQGKLLLSEFIKTKGNMLTQTEKEDKVSDLFKAANLEA